MNLKVHRAVVFLLGSTILYRVQCNRLNVYIPCNIMRIVLRVTHVRYIP